MPFPVAPKTPNEFDSSRKIRAFEEGKLKFLKILGKLGYNIVQEITLLAEVKRSSHTNDINVQRNFREN